MKYSVPRHRFKDFQETGIHVQMAIINNGIKNEF